MRAWLMAMMMCTAGAQAGTLVELQVVDREGGGVLPVYSEGGRQWVPGVPGHRYSVRLLNRSSERLLAVLSVDGVNAVSGETASTQQTGYVLGPWQQMDVEGWRKSLSQVAAFEFTALRDSYAARTGRPGNVGVIGVAVFRERRWLPEPSPPVGDLARAQAPAAEAAAPAPGRAASDAAGAAAPRDYEYRRREYGRIAQQESLGTGHGQREWSAARQVAFERESATPYEVVSLNYDSFDNLVAMGVIPQPWRRSAQPEPFPIGFVPDPR
jgi:hypothetical protein